MRTYLYTGGEKGKAVQWLAISTAGMQQPTLVVRFGAVEEEDPLAAWERVLPIEILRVRLPGLGWPLSRTPADQVTVQTALATLKRMIASGDYRLVLLDGIQEAVSHHLVAEEELKGLARISSEQTQIAMT